MRQFSHCPKCQAENVYFDGSLWNCPDCAHEWTDASEDSDAGETLASDDGVVRDAHGNVLADGDTVVVIKDLKVKGASSSVKVGTKVKNIRLVDSSDGHNISCKIDGFGAMALKSEFVKKA
jgi:protein PhnA